MTWPLDDPPHTLTVYPEVDALDDDSNPVKVPSATGVPVRMWVQPVTAAESSALGQSVTGTVRAFGRSFPGGPWARVEWDGREWDVVGDPMRWGGVLSINHVEVILTTRTARGL